MKIHQLNVSAYGLLTCAAFSVAFLAGCKNPEAQIPGTWTGKGNASVTLKEDKTFAQTSPVQAAGKWAYADKSVTLTIETVGGTSTQKALEAMEKMNLPQETKDKAKQQLKPWVFKVSDDFKTMSMPNPPPGITTADSTLTKQETK